MRLVYVIVSFPTVTFAGSEMLVLLASLRMSTLNATLDYVKYEHALDVILNKVYTLGWLLGDLATCGVVRSDLALERVCSNRISANTRRIVETFVKEKIFIRTDSIHLAVADCASSQRLF